MQQSEIDEYMNELLEKGAYRVEGVDPESGELVLSVVPEVMREVDPHLFEIYELEAAMEFEQSMAHLESLGLVTRLENDEFVLTDAAEKVLGE